MAIDYASLALVAQTLLEDNGRACTLIRLEETPTDANMPWRGSDFDAAEEVGATAVFLAFRDDDVDGDLIRRGDQRAFVAELTVPGVDLRQFDLLRDDAGLEWKVVSVETVRPGGTTLLFKLHLRK